MRRHNENLHKDILSIYEQNHNKDETKVWTILIKLAWIYKDQGKFLEMVNNAGFSNAKYRNLTMGVACLHSGWKI